MYKEIFAHCGTQLIVSHDDYDYLSCFKWRLNRAGYALRTIPCLLRTQRSSTLFMHRDVAGRMGLDPYLYIDHANRNTLDNTRENLRNCTKSQNAVNTVVRPQSFSPYKGVSRKANTKTNPWLAVITVETHQIHLGYFGTEEEAAEAYNLAAIKYHGEFAVFNQIPDTFERRTIPKKKTSTYRGVTKVQSKWRAAIGHQGKYLTIGTFSSELEAALAYNQTAIRLHGDKAKLNQI